MFFFKGINELLGQEFAELNKRYPWKCGFNWKKKIYIEVFTGKACLIIPKWYAWPYGLHRVDCIMYIGFKNTQSILLYSSAEFHADTFS